MCVHFGGTAWLVAATPQQLRDKIAEFDEYIGDLEASYGSEDWVVRDYKNSRDDVVAELRNRAERGVNV